MASHFQNRLVGISILVASVVIFLPSIIDGKKMTYEDEFVATPIHPVAKPHTQQLDLPLPKTTVSDVQTSTNVRSAPVPDEQWHVEEVAPKKQVVAAAPIKKPVVKAADPQRIVKKKVLPAHAWTIQLGAFKNLANINSLLKTLHKAGFQAHTVPTDVIDGELTRLFVGPDVSKEKLKKQLPRLKRLTKLEGKLIQFDAVNP